MPAIITHHLFGEDAATRLPEGIIDGQEELLAFLLGNQGPDPFWAHFVARRSVAAACAKLATDMHAGKVVEAFMALHDAVTHLPEDDKCVGRAFVLGLLSHYVLDSIAHPFVYAQETALCKANPELEPSRNEVHAIIESDLDTWMLWSQRGLTVERGRVLRQGEGRPPTWHTLTEWCGLPERSSRKLPGRSLVSRSRRTPTRALWMTTSLSMPSLIRHRPSGPSC